MLRPRTINLLDAFFLLRVFKPRAGLPHGVTGDLRPIGVRPSPPPCGWSLGFITEPRTVGRVPNQRVRPALPMFTNSWSALPTSPIVARQVPNTLRTSPEAKRTNT